MNKFITKIVGVALGLTLAIGVGVAVGVNNSEAREVDAATSTVNLNNTTFGMSGNSYSNYTYTTGGFTYKADNCNVNNSQLNMKASTGVVYNSTALTGKRIVSIALSNIGFSSSDGAGFYVYGGTTSKPTTTTLLNNTGSTTATTVSFAGYDYTYFQIKNKGSRTCRFSAVLTFEDAGQPATAVTVTIGGSLTKDTYSKTESWDNAGLTASGIYNTNTPYTGEFVWTYSPASPSDMNAGANQDLTITATVSSSGYSGSASKTVKVNVTASETSGITNGAKYIIVANSSYYFNGTISGGAGQTSSNKHEGMVFTFTLVDDYEYTITNGSNYVGVGSNSTSLSLNNTSKSLTVTKASSYYKISGSSGRYLSWYESNSEIRTYSSGTSYITLLAFDATEIAAEIKALSGGWSNNVETNKCAEHYQIAKARILQLSDADLNTFKTSEDDEIASARTTYQWWCHINNDDSPWSGAIVSSSRIALPTIENSNNTTLILVVIASISLVAVSSYFVIRRRREN